MNKVLLLLVATITASSASVYADGDILDALAISRQKHENNLHLLKDLPSNDLNNLRLYLPASNWKNFRENLGKGQVVRVVTEHLKENKDKKSYKGSLKFYLNSNFKGRPSFEFINDSIRINDKEICTNGTFGASQRSTSFYDCGVFYCIQRNDSSPTLIQNYKGLMDGLIDSISANGSTDGSPFDPPKRNKCSYDLYYYNSSSMDYYESFDLQISKLSSDNSSAEVIINGKPYFVDLRFCKETPSACKFFNRQFSTFEVAWINLKFAQSEKKYEPLNYLMDNLLPCVKKKDRKCVQSFFATEKDVRRVTGRRFPNPITTADDQVLQDLAKCLDYQNLLPFGGRSKANADNICIFFDNENQGSGPRYKIQSITLPDAFKSAEELIAVDYY